MQAVSTPQSKKDPALIYAVSACLFTLFLFFIDEGYYDFRWMRDSGNWFVFAIYFSGLMAGQVLTGMLFNRLFPKVKYGWIVTVGLFLGLGLVLGFFFCIH